MKKLKLFTILLFFITFGSNAQPGFEDDVQDVPLDGGITILAGTAIALGMNQKFRKSKKEAV